MNGRNVFALACISENRRVESFSRTPHPFDGIWLTSENPLANQEIFPYGNKYAGRIKRMATKIKSTPERPAPAMPAALQEVFFCISRAFYAYMACLERLLVENDLATHVRPGMGHVLFALFDQDDVIIKNLVQRTELSPSALTRILAEMERRDLITRRRDANDGRATRVHLTRLGRSLEGRCGKTLADVHRIICGDMPGHSIDAVTRGLAQMIANLRGQDAPPRENGTSRQSSRRRTPAAGDIDR